MSKKSEHADPKRHQRLWWTSLTLVSFQLFFTHSQPLQSPDCDSTVPERARSRTTRPFSAAAESMFVPQTASICRNEEVVREDAAAFITGPPLLLPLWVIKNKQLYIPT